MTQEEKQLLLRDLCARLPYGVKFYNVTTKNDVELYTVDLNSLTASFWTFKGNSLRIGNISSIFRNDGSIRLKPYLRPLSSMTEEELNECVEQSGIRDVECPNWHYLPKEKHFEARLNHSINMFLVDSRTIDWLNAHHFDYRGLIEMGLAIEASEGMYNT